MQKTLERLRELTAVIVIANRLSTIRSADQVIVVDRGEIIQSFDYAELAAARRSLIGRLLGQKELTAHGWGRSRVSFDPNSISEQDNRIT